MTSQNDELRFLLVNLTHISYRTSDTQEICKPEEIYEFLKFLNKFATSHSSQCVCYLSHKILTRIILQYPSLFALFGSCNAIFQNTSCSTLHFQIPFWRKIYFVQVLQSLLRTNSSTELIHSVVSYLYSQRLSFIESYFTEHNVVSCGKMELLILFESLLVLIRSIFRIQKVLKLETTSVVKEDNDLPYMIVQICSTFLFSKSVALIYTNSFKQSPFERVFYCGLIDLTYRYLALFAIKEILDEITRFAIYENQEFISNLESNPLNRSYTKELTLSLDNKDRYIKIVTDMVLLCLDLFRYYLINSSTMDITDNNFTLLLNRISYLISLAGKTQSDSTNYSLFYFYSQKDKSLFKFIDILLELHSFLVSNQVISPEVKVQTYRILPEPNELFLSFLIHTGFDHVLIIDLVTSEFNSTFINCFTSFLQNLIIFNQNIDASLTRTDNIFNSLHFNLTTYLRDPNALIPGYSTVYQFTDMLYKVILFLSKHNSKYSNKYVIYIISLLKELITKYDLCNINKFSENIC